MESVSQVFPFLPWSECFQELDQVALLLIAEGRLFREVARTKVVPTIHNEVRALAQCKQRLSEICKNLACILIRCIPGQSIQVML